jgi:CheY-like chemotaxis protein
MDGHEAIRRIRAMPGGQEPKIIAVTASAMDENRQELMEVGAHDFISKPFREAELFRKIHTHLGVRYDYAEEVEPIIEEEVAELSTASLAALPNPLIADLHEAVTTADLDQVLTIIDDIEEIDSSLARRLRKLAEAFRYQDLLDLLHVGDVVAST